ncbi:feruloyl-CoA synthase [Rhizobium halophytocola]|uniref:Feruloyl-CoA synthase n=1 Tax=Rhizobium halophytocola TaxID=735519 RepID=A0ABS4E1H5_9HYPH|nr:feruloyl-CoA synthase [Rhizobium halophytocola]MBP1851773.1 feruloyl-CoA synthase [Rhizobium halophytocola]
MGNAASAATSVWSPRLRWHERTDGTFLIWRDDPLGPYPDKITERFRHWAEVAPERDWLAERDATGGWRRLTYGQAHRQIRALAQYFLDLGLSSEKPVLILSENSIAHAVAALAAQYVGIPSAAIAPAYALVSEDFGKLREIAEQITPGLVFAADPTPFVPAIEAVFDASVPLLCEAPVALGRRVVTLDQAFGTHPGPAVEAAYDAVGPDTVAKFLFTSGTTGSPKAVIQTQRMLCSNQEMVADCYAFLRDEPPVVVDWAPWNHTASGNKVFNLVIYNGGTFYIDLGRPNPEGMKVTIANLREISPTWFFNVPAGYEMLVRAMREDEALRQNFFRRMQFMLYAGAGMAQHTWDELLRLCEETVGHRIILGTGLGSTETSPFALFCTEHQDAAGNIGLPAQGITVKLVPSEDKYELRLKGPNVTPGYWRNEKLTAEAFDEEGFYRIGDAVRFAEPGNPKAGFFFDGRIAENFKLDTGTWVAVGKLRAQLVDDFGGLIRDAVITGADRSELGALVLPVLPVLRALVEGGAAMSDQEVMAAPAVRHALAEKLAEHARRATGSASRIVRLMLLAEPPRFDRGEITDKGSVNQRAMLRNRAELVEALYAGGRDVIVIGTEKAA